MIRPFNELSPAQAERLALLLEELGEATQAVGKILRHGYESHNPKARNGVDNRGALTRELGDVIAAIEMMVDAADLSAVGIDIAKKDKTKRVGRYLHHQFPPPTPEVTRG